MSINKAVLVGSLVCVLAPSAVAATPDLAVTSFTTQVADRTVNYTVEICNTGSAATPSWFYVELFYHRASAPGCAATYDRRVSFNAMPAGNCTKHTFTRANTPLGDHRAWVMADGGCTVAESNEGNNLTSSKYSVKKPDLVLTSLTAAVQDRDVTYTVQVCNSGTSVLTKFSVDFFYDRTAAPGCADPHDVQLGNNGLAAGKCRALTFTRHNVPSGSYKAWVLADGGCNISEQNEGNNTASVAYAIKKADLYVKSLSAKVKDRDVSYEVEVCNKGTAVMTTFYVEVFHHLAAAPGCGTTHSDRVSFTKLAGGKCVTHTFTQHGAQLGPHTAWALADGDCAVTETNEGNNTASASYIIPKADLYLQSLTATVSDRSVSYKARVCNKGVSALTKFWLELYYDGTAAPGCATTHDDRVSFAGLKGGSCTDYTFKRQKVPIGKYTAWAMVDGDCQVMEQDETNQTASSTYEIKKPDLHVGGFSATVKDRTVTYEVKVCNKGTTALNMYSVEVFHDRSGAPACNHAPDVKAMHQGLGAGQCQIQTLTRKDTPPGKYTAWVLLDGDCLIAEQDETNQTASAGYAVARPDLYVASLKATVNDLMVTYKAEVCNKGTSVVKGFFVDLYHNRATAPGCSSPRDARVSFNGVGAGACKVYSFTRQNTPVGKHTAWVMADGGCAVTESDEGNNTGKAAHEVVPPDLYIKSFKVSTAGQSLSYGVTLCNKGSSVLKTFHAEVFYDRATAPGCADSYSDRRIYNGLAAGACANHTFSRAGATPGKFTAWMLVDSDCAVSESDEQNNTASHGYTHGPDLHVSKLQVKVDAAKVSYAVTVCNKGNPVLKPVDVAIFYHSPSAPSCSAKANQVYTLNGLDGGKCASHNFVDGKPVAGSYTAWAQVDPGCKIAELVETNNSASAKYAPRSDYYVSKVTAKPQPGTSKVDYAVTVCNKGAASGKPLDLGLYYHRTPAPGCKDVPDRKWLILSLKAGQCLSESHQRTSASSGSFTAWGRADVACLFSELDEQNNNLSLAYTVNLLPNLSVPSVTTTVAGDTVSLKVQVCNNGASQAPNFTVGFFFNQSKAPSCAKTPDRQAVVPGLAPGACVYRTFTRLKTPPGAYLGWIVADSTCAVSETNDTDNAKAASYLVLPPPADAGPDGPVPVADLGLDASPPDAAAEAGPLPDTGPMEAGPPADSAGPGADAAADAGNMDSGAPEAGQPEAGQPDAGQPEAGSPDANVAPDAGPGPDQAADAAGTDQAGEQGAPDAATTADVGPATDDAGGDAGQDGAGDAGCQCGVGLRGEQGRGLLLLLLVAGLALLSRRRR